MNISTLCCFTIASAFVLNAAHAQEMREDLFGPLKGNWELTLSGSGASEKDFDTGGAAANVSIGYYFTENWQAVLRQGIGFSDFGDSSWNGSTRVALDYNFNLDRWRPFVGVNFGGIYGDGVRDTFAAGLEAGVKYYVLQKTFVFASLEYQWF